MKQKELRAYKFRIYPAGEQIEFLHREKGMLRLLWNVTLDAHFKAHANGEQFRIGTYKQIFSQYKPEALKYLKEIDSDILNQGYMDVKNAFSGFFNSCKGNRKGKRVGLPNFKSRKTDNTQIHYTVSKISIIKNGYLKITRRLGLVKGVFHRFAEGTIKSCSFEETPSGKWFVSILVNKNTKNKVHNKKAIGIDWNCDDNDFMTLSNGEKISCPRFLKRSQKHLKHLQKIQSKRRTWEIKGKKMSETQTKSYEKISQQIALLNEKVANQRKDWLHKLSYEFAQKYEYVIVEDINLQNMSEMNHGTKIGDQGFGMFRQFVSYKTNLIKVKPHYTSQDCHICGYRNSDLRLQDREWTCPSCGTHHDRDINAAINILRKGIESIQSSHKDLEIDFDEARGGEPPNVMLMENYKVIQ